MKKLALALALTTGAPAAATVVDEELWRCVKDTEAFVHLHSSHCPGFVLQWSATGGHGIDCEPCGVDMWISVTDSSTGSLHDFVSIVTAQACGAGPVKMHINSPCTGTKWVTLVSTCTDCYDVLQEDG